MLVFTLVTIVFVSALIPCTSHPSTDLNRQLPMSFISSFFALGIQEFPKDSESGNTSWPINEVSAYLCEYLNSFTHFESAPSSPFFFFVVGLDT